MTYANSKTFNIAGPCIPSEHYMIPALNRNDEIIDLIDQKAFFILHAPRQSGKTTLLKALTETINNVGLYHALNIPIFSSQYSDDIEVAIDLIARSIVKVAKSSSIPAIASLADPLQSFYGEHVSFRIENMLNFMCSNLNKELIVFFDEADNIPDSSMITFLSQIRNGYLYRNEPNKNFPRALALVGMLDIADYGTHLRSDGLSKGTGSPFNVDMDSVSLPDFTEDDIRNLYSQHTEATGQDFADSAIERAWYWTEGQPWLVNALAYLIINRKLKNDYSPKLNGAHFDEAAGSLIMQNRSHFRSLKERLKDPRILRTMDTVISGLGALPKTVLPADVEYCVKIGLLKPGPNGIYGSRPSNPIYQDVIVRILSSGILMDRIPPDFTSKWIDGRVLDMSGLLRAFQDYWIENAEMIDSKSMAQVYMTSAPEPISADPETPLRDNVLQPPTLTEQNVKLSGILTESFCVLVLFAYLQRVLNGEAEIRREFALGKKFADIVATYRTRWYPIEIKIKGIMSKRESLAQLQGYIDRCNATEGWLVVFDRGTGKTLKEKSSWEIDDSGKNTKHIVNC
ncbi:MAG: AAA-like domain-containing protein [Deltaproteobacteria bacterium]|jgi:hypothetical protein|nr:AAA-like domain-containing protein [Deltaproteobacteria bacterium]